MSPERPDLSNIDPAIRDYIEYLEREVERLQQDERSRARTPGTAPMEPSEPPTTINVITCTAGGLIKRTPRHFYGRQRRGGMGVFGMDCDEQDPPNFLVVADESERLLVITNRSRAFLLRVNELPEMPIHSKGQPLSNWLPLQPGERPNVLLPLQDQPFIQLVSEKGWVRRVGGNIISNLKPGTVLDVRQGDPPVAACWSSGRDDLFIVTGQGKAIRFSERQVPIKGGCLGIRIDQHDPVIGVTAVQPEDGVLLLGHDGKGTVRQMSGFRANKAPGAGGKQAFKTDRLVGVEVIRDNEDVFAISRLGKIIRFAAAEIPAKEGVVQGVNCMGLRADEVTACTVSPAPTTA
jgi:DNA gyrase subunit A